MNAPNDSTKPANAKLARPDTKAFHRAVLNKDEPCIRILLEKDPQLGASPWALWMAAREGFEGILELLLPHADPMEGDSEGWTALAYAIGNRHQACFERVLARCPQASSSVLADGSTMLMVACKADSPAMVEALWGRVDLSARDAHGRDALDVARQLITRNSPNANAARTLLALAERLDLDGAANGRSDSPRQDRPRL
jgi:hypothetical protein